MTQAYTGFDNLLYGEYKPPTPSGSSLLGLTLQTILAAAFLFVAALL